MKTIKKFTLALLLFAIGCLGQTTLDATASGSSSHWGSDECSYLKPDNFRDLLGLKKFGLCQAYCQVLKCDQLPENPERLLGKIRAKACEKAFENWSKAAPGEVLPCLTAPAITFTKEVLNTNEGQLNVGDPVQYKFIITNTGNTPLRDVILSDGMLPEGELDSCLNSLSGEVLASNEIFECESQGSIIVEDDPGTEVENIANVHAISTIGSIPVSAEASAGYIVAALPTARLIAVIYLDNNGNGVYNEDDDTPLVEVHRQGEGTETSPVAGDELIIKSLVSGSAGNTLTFIDIPSPSSPYLLTGYSVSSSEYVFATQNFLVVFSYFTNSNSLGISPLNRDFYYAVNLVNLTGTQDQNAMYLLQPLLDNLLGVTIGTPTLFGQLSPTIPPGILRIQLN